ncbi:MAG: multidrug effflux MFS transporter [Alphaproteobacteria bacterium]
MSDSRPGPVRSPPLWLLILATATGPASLHVILPSIPALARDFATSAGEAQLALTVFLGSMAFAQIVYGPLSDRYGRRPVLLLGLAAYVAGTILCAAAWSIESLLAGRFVQAFGGCAGMVLGRAIVRDVHGRERSASLIAYITMAMSLAPMAAPALGGFLEEWAGWRWSFIVLSAVGTLTLVCAWPLLTETRATVVPIHPQAIAANFWLLLRSRPFLGYMLGTSFATAAWYSFCAGAPYLLVAALDQSPSAYGLWILPVMLGYTLGNMVAGRFAPRLGLDRMIRLGNGFTLLGAVVMVAWTQADGLSAPALFGSMTIMTWGHGLGQPNGVAGALSVHPHIAGSASGLLGFVQMTVSAGVTLLLGAVQAPSAGPTVAVVAVTTALSVGCFMLATAARRRPTA